MCADKYICNLLVVFVKVNVTQRLDRIDPNLLGPAAPLWSERKVVPSSKCKLLSPSTGMIIAPGYLTAEECRTGSRDKTWLQLLTGQATAWLLPDLLLKQTLVNKGLRKL